MMNAFPPSYQNNRSYELRRYRMKPFANEYWIGSGWSPDPTQAARFTGSQAYDLIRQWQAEDQELGIHEWDYTLDYKLSPL